MELKKNISDFIKEMEGFLPGRRVTTDNIMDKFESRLAKFEKENQLLVV